MVQPASPPARQLGLLIIFFAYYLLCLLSSLLIIFFASYLLCFLSSLLAYQRARVPTRRTTTCSRANVLACQRDERRRARVPTCSRTNVLACQRTRVPTRRTTTYSRTNGVAAWRSVCSRHASKQYTCRRPTCLICQMWGCRGGRGGMAACWQ